MEENKKNKMGIGILIGVLITLVIGLTGFIVYDKLLSKSDNNIQQENNNEVEFDEEIDSSVSNLKEISNSDLKIILGKINVYDIAFGNSYPINNFSEFSNSISNQDKLKFMFVNISGSFLEKFNKSDLEMVALKYFNDNFNYINEDIICFLGHTQHKYNSDNGVYTFDGLGHGGEGSHRIKSYFVKGNFDEVKDEFIINSKVLYGDYCSDTCPNSQKYYDSASQLNVVYENNSNDPMDAPGFDEVYELVKNKLPITTYRFVKNKSGEIVLKSVTVE